MTLPPAVPAGMSAHEKKRKSEMKLCPPAAGGDELCLDWCVDATKYFK